MDDVVNIGQMSRLTVFTDQTGAATKATGRWNHGSTFPLQHSAMITFHSQIKAQADISHTF